MTGVVDSPKSGFRYEIQGLRAVAVLLVVVFHIWPTSLTGGFVGVDVFFVISGYLITGLLVREVDQHGRISLPNFYARRIKRLLPAATLVIVAVAIASYLVMSEIYWQNTAIEIVASAFYFENWWLAYNATDYFEQDVIASPLQHFWTLSVEEQFYIVWPLLIILGAFLHRAWNLRSGVLVCLLLVFGASFLYSVWLTPRFPDFAYFATTARAWELALGGLLALLHRRYRPGAVLSRWLGSIGLVAILLAGLFYSTSTSFPGYAAALPTAGAALVILAGGAEQGRWSAFSFLKWSPMQFIGGISYSLYLWHWPVIVFYQISVGTNAIGVWHGAGLLGLTVILASLSKYLVEDPFHRSPVKQGGLWRPYVLGVACLSLCVAGAVLLLLPRQSGQMPSMGSDVGVIGGEAMLPGYRPAFVPSLADARRDIPDEYRKCHAPMAGTVPQPCIIGPADASFTLALVGDSHAGHWAPALFAAADALGGRVAVYTKSSCPFTEARVLRKSQDRDAYEECSAWNRALVELLESEPPDLVVVSGSNMTPAMRSGEERNVDAIARGYVSYWGRLLGRGVPIVAIRDTPRPGQVGINPPQCLSDSSKRISDCDAPRERALVDEQADAIFIASSALEGVSYLDMTDSICGAVACEAVVGNVLVWRDTNHLTGTYAKSLAPVLARTLRPLLEDGDNLQKTGTN